jgi:hypothetical protein
MRSLRGSAIGRESSLGATGDRAAALAAGGLLAMLTDSLMMQKGGPQAGVWTLIGFAASLAAA